jgi:CTP synthase (UTP-ammonia lyase)
MPTATKMAYTYSSVWESQENKNHSNEEIKWLHGKQTQRKFAEKIKKLYRQKTVSYRNRYRYRIERNRVLEKLRFAFLAKPLSNDFFEPFSVSATVIAVDRYLFEAFC